MNVLELTRSCPYGKEVWENFVAFAHKKREIFEIKLNLYKHVEGCNFCKSILKELVKGFIEERKNSVDQEKINVLIDRLDILVIFFCTPEERHAELWDEERWGAFEELKAKSEKVMELVKQRLLAQEQSKSVSPESYKELCKKLLNLLSGLPDIDHSALFRLREDTSGESNVSINIRSEDISISSNCEDYFINLIPRNMLPAAAGALQLDIFGNLLADCGLPPDLAIIFELQSDGYAIRIETNDVLLELTIVFLKDNQELYKTRIGKRIPENLIKPELIQGWTHIKLLC